MSFFIKNTDGCFMPAIWCEVCNTEITDIETGIVYWNSEDRELGYAHPSVAHKGCAPNPWSNDSMELSAFLVSLAQNLGMSEEKIAQAIALGEHKNKEQPDA